MVMGFSFNLFRAVVLAVARGESFCKAPGRLPCLRVDEERFGVTVTFPPATRKLLW